MFKSDQNRCIRMQGDSFFSQKSRVKQATMKYRGLSTMAAKSAASGRDDVRLGFAFGVRSDDMFGIGLKLNFEQRASEPPLHAPISPTSPPPGGHECETR
jgi:hypothetical protein